MADVVTQQDLVDAKQDAAALEVAVNGDENTDVTARLGRKYPTLAKALRILQQSGIGANQYATYADMLADVENISVGGLAIVYDDPDSNIIDDSVGTNNVIWIKISSTFFRASPYNPTLTAKVEIEKFFNDLMINFGESFYV